MAETNVVALNTSDAAQIRDDVVTDLDKWAAFCLPEEELLPFPDLYKYMWAKHLECLLDTKNDIPHRLGLGLPRGFVKTTMLKLLVAAAIAYRLREFILVAGQREDRAQEFTRDVEHIITSPNFKSLFVDYEKLLNDPRHGKNTKAHKEFRYPESNQPTILMAIGAGTSIRGVNIAVTRPDWIILDDVQSRECAESEAENSALIAWVTLTLLKCGRSRGMTHTFLGNLYNDRCLLWLIKNNPEWHTVITGAILASGDPLWPEFQSYESLASEFRNDVSLGQAAGFFAEKQNDIRPVASRLMEVTDLLYRDVAPVDDYEGFFVTVDPAGTKKNSNNTAIILHGIRGVEIDHITGTVDILDPEKTIQVAIDYAVQYGAPVIFVEAVAYQHTLAFWLNKYLRLGGLEEYIVGQPFTPGVTSKLDRIKGWAMGAKSHTFAVCDLTLMSKMVWEIQNFDVRLDDNDDDTLDCSAMAPLCHGKFPDMIFKQVMLSEINQAADTVPFRSAFDTLPLHSLQRYGYPL